MTQEVQPLTWQKRTNLEEHQQFFSKINEIIANLAPTVDEAEAAIAQATQAIASANDAIATANAASAAADAAAQQAQTAATTVAGYNSRLTAAEGDIDALQAADQTITGNVTALGTRMTAAESKNSQQDTAIGALQTADAQNVKISRINDYALGLTGSQEFSGIKKATATGFFRKKSAMLDLSNPVITGASATDETFVLEDKNGATAVQVFNSYTPEAQTIFQMASKYVFDDNGTVKNTNGMIWMAVYSNRVRLYLRFIDRNGTSHMREIASVSETD